VNITASAANGTAVTVADLNKDSNLDLVLGYENASDRIHYGNGGGAFSLGPVLPQSSGNTTGLQTGDVTGTGQQVIFANRGKGHLELRLDANNSALPNMAVMDFFTGGDAVNAKVSTPYLQWQPNRWYHVLVRRENNTTMTLYRDGIELARATVPQGNNAADKRIALGYRPVDSMMPLYGGVDGFRLYDRALTPFEIAQLHTQETPYMFDRNNGLIAHYSFNAQNGQDSSLRDNHGGFGTGANAPSPVTDRLGKVNEAISLDGNDHVEANSTSATNFTDLNFAGQKSFSVSAWAKPTDITQTNWILGYGNATDTAIQIGFTGSRLITAVPPLNPNSNGTLGTALTNNNKHRNVVMTVERGGALNATVIQPVPLTGLLAYYPFAGSPKDVSINQHDGQL